MQTPSRSFVSGLGPSKQRPKSPIGNSPFMAPGTSGLGPATTKLQPFRGAQGQPSSLVSMGSLPATSSGSKEGKDGDDDRGLTLGTGALGGSGGSCSSLASPSPSQVSCASAWQDSQAVQGTQATQTTQSVQAAQAAQSAQAAQAAQAAQSAQAAHAAQSAQAQSAQAAVDPIMPRSWSEVSCAENLDNHVYSVLATLEHGPQLEEISPEEKRARLIKEGNRFKHCLTGYLMHTRPESYMTKVLDSVANYAARTARGLPVNVTKSFYDRLLNFAKQEWHNGTAQREEMYFEKLGTWIKAAAEKGSVTARRRKPPVDAGLATYMEQRCKGKERTPELEDEIKNDWAQLSSEEKQNYVPEPPKKSKSSSKRKTSSARASTSSASGSASAPTGSSSKKKNRPEDAASAMRADFSSPFPPAC